MEPRLELCRDYRFAFHMGSHGNQRLDIENFIKPTLDALAAGLFCPNQTNPREIARMTLPYFLSASRVWTARQHILRLAAC